MLRDQILIINREDLPELAKLLAPLIKEGIKTTDQDPYLTPAQLAEVVPSMSVSMIRTQIRGNCYGKKQGPKGKLVARASEVKKYNRI
mgnify:CR=1 FL=1